MTDQSDDTRIANVDDHAVAPATLFTDERIEIIRNTVAKGAPDDVFRAMIDIARTRNLDPLAKQIGVAQFDKNSGYQIYMPIDGYRAVAGDHPDFAGKDKPEYGPVIGQTPMGKNIPEWCSVTVYRLVRGQRMPFTAEVWWDEFYGGERNRSWNKMPRVMLAKVAEAHALRMAFTRSLSGTYTPDEMDQASVVDVPARTIDRTTGEVTEIPAGGDPERAMRRLHAVARDVGIDHDVLHEMAVRMGAKSLKDLQAHHLEKLANRIEGDPDAAREFARVIAKPREQAPLTDTPVEDDIDAALANATPGSEAYA